MIQAVIKLKDNSIIINSEQVETVGKKFEKGLYRCWVENQNIKIKGEKFPEIHIPHYSKEIVEIIRIVQNFFEDNIKEKVNKLGFVHKLGILLYGIQGGGKSSLLVYLSKLLEDNKNAIIFTCNSSTELVSSIGIAKKIREIQDNPIVFICDEFERFAENNESEMKNFLDGIESIDNTLFLAATNYINNIPKTLSERPSRFKIVRELKGITDKQVMKDILNNISSKIEPNLFSSEEITDIIKNTESTTIDELKHICLNHLTNTKLKISNEKQRIGFSIEERSEEEAYTPVNMWDIVSLNKEIEENKKIESILDKI